MGCCSVLPMVIALPDCLSPCFLSFHSCREVKINLAGWFVPVWINILSQMFAHRDFFPLHFFYPEGDFIFYLIWYHNWSDAIIIIATRSWLIFHSYFLCRHHHHLSNEVPGAASFFQSILSTAASLASVDPWKFCRGNN